MPTLQVLTVSDTKTYAKKTHSVAAAKVKIEKDKIGETKPMKFGDLDDMIRVAEYEKHELYSDIEILKFKETSPPELCVAEYPPIPVSLCDLKNELERAKNRLYRLRLEKAFILKKRKQKK